MDKHECNLQDSLKKLGVTNVEVEGAPSGCQTSYNTIITPAALQFVAQLVAKFDAQVDHILRHRELVKLHLDETQSLPDFSPSTKHIRTGQWRVSTVPKRLQCRHVDLGDVSPTDTQHFIKALRSNAQGIQTDFDDGHCPTWRNQLLGLYNVYLAVHGKLAGLGSIAEAPVLMLRPRAWNMYEHNMLVSGKEAPGPLFDFGLLMYHCGVELLQCQSGPFFYLSKIEDHIEARLWNEIFVWTQEKLGMPTGSIKACVLIENILAAFQMEEILYELREHSAGLNCGLWDYSASFVNKFGYRPEFVLPDRSKYVNMERHFLRSYMDLVVKTCHSRGTLATGGMAARLLPEQRQEKEYQSVVESVCRAKLREIQAGADGFMVYDLGLVQPPQDLFRDYAPSANQIHLTRSDVNVQSTDLLLMPSGGVTLEGLKHNIGVGILFISAWLQGKGHYYYKGAVEDSATAEISRSQVWQWIRHGARLEEHGDLVTRAFVQMLISEFLTEHMSHTSSGPSNGDKRRLVTAALMFEEIVTKRYFPEFITTYLNLDHTFLNEHTLKKSLL